MTKLENTLAPLLKRIDELLIGEHPFLQSTDEVYYLSEYTNGKRAEFSKTNQLILNYKKEPKWKGTPSWSYKEPAIRQVADSFRLSILQTSGFSERIKKALLVPIPPHAMRGAPDYDDRNLKMLNHLMPNGNIHELVVQKQSRAPLHESSKRDPKLLEENYEISALNGHFEEIWLFDDVLRNGTHFRAMHNILRQKYPNIKIIGFFVARSVQYITDPFTFAEEPDF